MLVGVGIFEPSFCLIGLEGCLWRELEWGGWDLVRVGCLGFFSDLLSDEKTNSTFR